MGGQTDGGVRIRRNVLIPLRDRTRLAADVYLPPGRGPFPTLVSAYPYHKDDYIGVMLDHPCRTFAGHGYASVVVDMRGTGGSEGVAWEPFQSGEAEDSAEIVEWAGTQDFSNGRVGMWGISYGAVTTLQAAAKRPPHLEAIAATYACTDGYHDFVYPGGCLNCLSAFGSWGSLMLAMQLMPPATADPEGRWYRVWMDRLEACTPYSLSWHEHPTHDEYWEAAAIPVERIEAPALLFGGWRELFPESMMATFSRLSGPKQMFVGPWGHYPPDFPFGPEPMDHLGEMVRWWDRWLKGAKDGGGAEEPALTFYLQGKGSWHRERTWPPSGTEDRVFSFSSGRALRPGDPPPAEGSDVYRAVPSVGATAGLWELMSLGVGQPLDQGPDELRSLTYTSEPLAEDSNVCGSPEALLHVAVEGGREVHLVAKLSDVTPDGQSHLITTGWLKVTGEATQATGHERAAEVRLRLWATAYRIAKGHRLRLSIACSDFPRIFPAASNATIRVDHGANRPSRLVLPCAPLADLGAGAPSVARPDPSVPPAPAILEAVPRWKIEHDLIAESVTVLSGLRERFLLPAGGELRMEHDATASVSDPRPDGAKVEGRTRMHVRMPSGEEVEVATETSVSLRRILLQGSVTLDGRTIFEKRWHRSY